MREAFAHMGDNFLVTLIGEIIMNTETLLKNGYNRYAPTHIDDSCITDVYQRSFRDEYGNKKYFLTFNRWDFSRFRDEHHPDLGASFEGNTQLTHKETGNVLDITFLSGWDVDEAEKFMEHLFNTGWFKKYEEEY